MPVHTEPEAGIQIDGVRQFALAQFSSSLASDPALLAAFWKQVGEPVNPGRPDLTVFYCSVRWLGRKYALLEFVAGETLEELVKRSDPAACEWQVPLFCRLLDAFDDPAKAVGGQLVQPTDLELIDFGIGRASASLTSKLHGAVLVGPGGDWSEQVFGEYGASRSQVYALLMELCARLPGQLPHSSKYGSANLGECAVCSLATQSLPSKLAFPIAAPPVKSGLLARTLASPYVVAALTTTLVLSMLYGVGGFLAKRSSPPNAGKLLLPTYSPAVPPPIEIAPIEPPSEPVPIPVRTSSQKRAPRQPILSIVLARGARPIRQTSLEYPAAAQKEHISGTVELQVTIAEDGSVQSPRVLSGDPLLRAGLTEEISKWVYQPMRVNGKPVAMTTELAIRFNLTP
jgi:TonB family protein